MNIWTRRPFEYIDRLEHLKSWQDLDKNSAKILSEPRIAISFRISVFVKMEPGGSIGYHFSLLRGREKKMPLIVDTTFRLQCPRTAHALCLHHDIDMQPIICFTSTKKYWTASFNKVPTYTLKNNDFLHIADTECLTAWIKNLKN